MDNQFKPGDFVVRRKENRGPIHTIFNSVCSTLGVDEGAVFKVGKVDGPCLYFDGASHPLGSQCFRVATFLERIMGTSDITEGLLKDKVMEQAAHIECARDLLEDEKQKVTELRYELEQTTAAGTVGAPDQLVAELEEKLAVATKLNHALTDQREAAVIAAKSLGEDVRALRKELSALRYSASADLCGHVGILQGLEQAVNGIDLVHLREQLELIGRTMESIGNGADAELAFSAALVVNTVSSAVADWYHL